MLSPVVFLALPHRNDFSSGTLMGMLNTGHGHRLLIRERQNSLLPLCFNSLWCDALNNRHSHGLTHFSMMHCDIGPEPGWLDTLLAEQQRVGADILSVVAPIKDERGLTSTSIRCPRTDRLRRLTMQEVCKLPPTFDAEMAGFPGQMLLANTGLWVCDFTKPWVERMVFRQQDGIVKNQDGIFRTICLSEDWLFSLDAHAMGLKVFATTKVKLRHKGEFQFPNFAPWGNWATDEQPAQPDFCQAIRQHGGPL